MSDAPRLERITVPKTARYYRLGELGGATDEVWIACHGYGQLAARFVAGFAPIVSPSRAIVAPEALHRFYLDPPDRPAANRRVGATWMTREEREDDIADYIRYLEHVAAEIASAAPRARLIAFGFSQGVATVSRWVVASERAFARAIVWGSDLPGDLDWARAAGRFATIPLVFVIGERDEFATPERIARQEAALARHGIRGEIVRFPGGHALDRDVLLSLSGASGPPPR